MKIPFKVSARTARLIGRENIASSKGAIIELVKNAYDADSPLCIIYFSSNDLYIIDAGEGMTQDIIINHWMTIGTNNKEYEYLTKQGRIKSGAKGIGRFALDKLGVQCSMLTKYNPTIHKDINQEGQETSSEGYLWNVDWSDFEKGFKTIDFIEADLTELKQLDLKSYIQEDIKDERLNKIINNEAFNSGTVLKISNLRDHWDDYLIEQLYSDLEVLTPPREHNKFRLYLFSEINNKYGEILGSTCDDYDYKIVANADANENVSIKIFRNEYNLNAIDPKLFDRNFFQNYPYTKSNFDNGYWEIKTSFAELLPGYKIIDKDKVLSQIGSFDFTLYFMKRSYSDKDIKKYFYHHFNSSERKAWLNKFGGIKIFRDGFRIRPYGEIESSAFDWLTLGARKSNSPAAISHPSHSWKVAPDVIAGSINISRVSNLSFQDKSSREGLQENKIFKTFQKIILAIISTFEKDRAKIAHELSQLNKESEPQESERKTVDELIKKILDENLTNNTQPDLFTEKSENYERFILAKSLKDRNEEIEKLEDEQKILRCMASSGIVVASFAHELSNLSDLLDQRSDELKDMLENLIPSNSLSIDECINPYVLIEDMRDQDTKLRSWMNFAITAIRKDKRKRKILDIDNYFKSLKRNWGTILKTTKINFDLNCNSIAMKAFEIDLDSIFNNLIINSIDAFMLQNGNSNREIKIRQSYNEREVLVDYFDNGPGISKDITNHEDLFNPLYTTKRDKNTGKEIGTGLGMWLIKTIMKEYNGSAKLLYHQNSGFGIRLSFTRTI